RRPQRTLRGVAPHGPVPVLLLEGLREAAAAREVPLDRRALLPPGRIHREAAEAGRASALIVSEIVQLCGVLHRAPSKLTFPFSRARRVFCMRVRQTSYPRSQPRRRDRPWHPRKWHSARVPLFLRRDVALL